VYGVVEVVGVGVQRRWCCSEASSRFSTHVIGLSSRICGALYGHDEHWFPCPPVYPSFIWRCARVTHCHNNDRRPPIRTRMKIFSYMEDHIPKYGRDNGFFFPGADTAQAFLLACRLGITTVVAVPLAVPVTPKF
jgi:hypothetical protein